MNTFATNTSAAQSVARQIIAERVRDAEERRIARTVRHDRRAARASRPRSTSHRLSGWALRFVHPAH